MNSRAKGSKKRGQRKAEKAHLSASVPKGFASKVLGSVPRENAFYFYSSVGNPTGVVASSFDEFCESAKASPSESLEFHLMRGDFENWIRFLGDQELALQLEKLKAANLSKEELVRRFLSRIEERHDLLRKSA